MTIVNGLMILFLITLSGLSDAYGVLHASQVWQEGRLVLAEVAKSALGFTGGIVIYWGSLRFMKEAGIVAPEVQTLIWFGVMMISVALVSGAFFKWRLAEQLMAFIVAIGILYLTLRTGQ